MLELRSDRGHAKGANERHTSMVFGVPMSMRFTIVGNERELSFSGPGHLLKMITAVVANGCVCLSDLLDGLEVLDDQFVAGLRRELSIFDEHCLAGDEASTVAWFASCRSAETQAFRIIDPLTRRKSTDADRLGLTIFNLGERRIVQVQNSYGNLQRRDRGRIRRAGKPIGRYYAYELPASWTIVP